MTIADFLMQAGLWQWIGMIILASLASQTVAAVFKGIGNFRMFTINEKAVAKTKEQQT